jgi:hypothetical protein
MPQQDTSAIKERIISFIRMRGPCLPVHIAKEIGMSILFTSAFLSELISERRIKTSNMKVGSSSLHFIEGQESRLENFAQYLKSREKDAFELLKLRRFLDDTKQEPAIRVALRAIKDFAISFERNGKIIWRYFTIPESDYIEIKPLPKIKEQIPPVIAPKPIQNPPIPKELDIFSKEEPPKEKPAPIKKIKRKKKPSQKKNEKFFDKVKEFLSKKQIEIIDIEGFSKSDLTLKVKKDGKELLLIALNKKRISDLDIIKASKKASEKGLQYILLSLGEPLKKLSNLIDAVKGLSGIEKIE